MNTLLNTLLVTRESWLEETRDSRWWCEHNNSPLSSFEHSFWFVFVAAGSLQHPGVGMRIMSKMMRSANLSNH